MSARPANKAAWASRRASVPASSEKRHRNSSGATSASAFARHSIAIADAAMTPRSNAQGLLLPGRSARRPTSSTTTQPMEADFSTVASHGSVGGNRMTSSTTPQVARSDRFTARHSMTMPAKNASDCRIT